MKIENNKVVSVKYELRADSPDGEVIELTKENEPLTFLFGKGAMLAAFENNLLGLNLNDNFSFTLKPEEAYGEVSENAIVDLPLDIFKVDGKIEDGLLTLGNAIPMKDKNGTMYNGIVEEVMEDKVKMDFNHPLAGETLCFSGQVVEIRDATDEELQHGHVHNASCGCDGECDDNCQPADKGESNDSCCGSCNC